MKVIFLIGFMGSGKTSTAKKISSHLGIPCLDTDELVVSHTGMAIPEIFAKKGEDYFRQQESAVLRNVPVTNAVIATGGGIINKLENRKWMQENGVVVYLETAWDQIVKRLGKDSSRPLWNGKEDLFDSRQAVYAETASLIVSTDHKTPATVAEEIIYRLDLSAR